MSMTWDQYQDFIKGKLFLIGFTFYDSNNNLLEEYQTSGRVEHITDNGILVLKRDDGSFFAVPYDTNSIGPASPGEYTEHATGKVITDPDYIMTGDIEVKDAKHVAEIKANGFYPE